MKSKHFLGLRTACYATTDLARAKAWYTEVAGHGPYFDQPFYVGFNIGGFELGIVPVDAAHRGPATDDRGCSYWGVPDAAAAHARLLALGATPLSPVTDVGDGIKIGSVTDPFGNALGIIENPHFTYEP
jgi:predicted enzyme related to lactoylglutathione lyase